MGTIVFFGREICKADLLHAFQEHFGYPLDEDSNELEELETYDKVCIINLIIAL